MTQTQSYGRRHNIRKVYASPPPLQLFTSGITNLFSTNVASTYVEERISSLSKKESRFKPCLGFRYLLLQQNSAYWVSQVRVLKHWVPQYLKHSGGRLILKWNSKWSRCSNILLQYKLTNFCREKKVRHFVRQENIFKEFNIFYAKINTAESIFWTTIKWHFIGTNWSNS